MSISSSQSSDADKEEDFSNDVSAKHNNNKINIDLGKGDL